MLNSTKFLKLSNLKFVKNFGNFTRKNPRIIIAEEVVHALNNNFPVVALESTIITHGMPYPRNVECAVDVEEQIRLKGAVPATIAIRNGDIKVGLSKADILELGDICDSKTLKTSRRDLAYVIANKLNGGTTVSGTLFVCNQVGIPIFATGGIGGVHRFGEKTFDISADLTELGKSSVAVFSSGVKSILDIPKTLEYLETQGVFVASYGETKEFPAFYCRRSGQNVPYNVDNPITAAEIILANHECSLNSGMVFGVPVPQEYALDDKETEKIIDEALNMAEKNKISGKDVTPFLLARLAEVTSGKSLQTNIALVKNNARAAADVAVELSKLRRKPDLPAPEPASRDARVKRQEKRPMIIGGSVLDRCATILDSEIKLDGRIHDGKFTESPGGVARNIADALSKLGCEHKFLSAVGNDTAGELLCSQLSSETSKYIKKIQHASTAQCAVILDSNGECRFLIGDMEIHKEISSELIKQNEDLIKDAAILILDANPTVAALQTALEIAIKHQVPVFFEPTDLLISEKPFTTPFWKAIKYISPNLNELKHIAHTLGIKLPKESNKLQEAISISKLVSRHIDNVIVTLGAEGLVIARHADASKPLLLNQKLTDLQIRHYPASSLKYLANVSGAGDCLVAGLISAMLQGISEEICMSVGFQSARFSLESPSAVPGKLFGKDDLSWRTTMREFVEKYYVGIKSQNPTFPILVRECSNIEPKLWARFEFGKESSYSLKNLSADEIFGKVEAAAKH